MCSDTAADEEMILNRSCRETTPSFRNPATCNAKHQRASVEQPHRQVMHTRHITARHASQVVPPQRPRYHIVLVDTNPLNLYQIILPPTHGNACRSFEARHPSRSPTTSSLQGSLPSTLAALSSSSSSSLQTVTPVVRTSTVHSPHTTHAGHRLHFVKFETRQLDQCMDFIASRGLNRAPLGQPLQVRATGGGAHKYRQARALLLHRVDYTLHTCS